MLANQAFSPKLSVVAEGNTRKPPLRSTLVSRNIVVSGHRTSVRLEPEMWDGLHEICRRERSTLHQVCTSVAQEKCGESSLTASIRVYVMRYYRTAATEDGHGKAGHGFGLALGMGSSASYGNRPTATLTRTSFA